MAQQNKIEEKTANQVVLVEGNLRKIVHQEGQGDSPIKGQQVFALYRGTLQTGEQFDSNQDRQSPFKFTVGVGQVIKAWDQGFISMKRGEKATLICSPEYGYGARGSPPKIPPNSTLHFEVELIDFQDKEKQKWELSTQEKVSEATKLKGEGNQHLKNGKYPEAIKAYEKGIQYVDFETDQAAKDILKVLRMNISQAFINNKQYASAIENCNKVLSEDEGNLKSLYRRGVAYARSQQYENAKNDMNAILAKDANHAQAKNQLIKISKELAAFKQKQKKMFGSMFAKANLYEDKKPEEKKEPEEEDQEQQEMPELQKTQEKEEKQ